MKQDRGIIVMKSNITIPILLVFLFSVVFSNAFYWEKRVNWLQELNNIESNKDGG